VLSSRRFSAISLITLALGSGLFMWRQQGAPSQVKSVESYWNATGLKASSLEDLLQDQTCSSSERYFLACANAILTIANKFNLTMTPQGQLVAPSADVDMSSEKNQLLPWKAFYGEHLSEARKISFLKTWKVLQKKYISHEQKTLMIGTGLNGFISVFKDPHTYLMPVSMFQEVVSKADNHSVALGIYLSQVKGQYILRKVSDGSLAQKAGMKKGDIILTVNGQDITGLLQARVTELLKGDVGSVTKITFSRDGSEKKLRLVRTESTVATVSTRIIDGIKPIAVITLNKFAKEACVRTKEALEIANRAHVKGLVLDLRDNPGGQMEEASCIASLFVGPEQKIFDLKYLDPTKAGESFFGEEQKIFSKPMAILINASSASAAEILAGALHDLNRAVLVGERTFGKGSFQEGELWSENKKIALFETKGFYYLPSGQSPQQQGLKPDIELTFSNLPVGREEDLFMNPLRAPHIGSRPAAISFNDKNCLDIEDDKGQEDVQLSRARQVLFCSKNVAGVNHD